MNTSRFPLLIILHNLIYSTYNLMENMSITFNMKSMFELGIFDKTDC